MERTPLSIPSTKRRFIRALADAFVASPWRADDLIASGNATLSGPRRWLVPLVNRLIKTFEAGARPTADRVVSYLDADRGFQRVMNGRTVRLRNGLRPRPTFWPASGRPTTWSVPPILTPGELADFLELEPSVLDWFADRQGRLVRSPSGPLSHYRYTWRSKAGGTRLIEAPKPRLKAIQRRLLDTILSPIVPHDAAHGFRPGRSVTTFAAPHAGQRVVLKMDLKQFFPTIGSARVVSLFLAAGYPEAVARCLAGLCTNRVPLHVWKSPDAPSFSSDLWRIRRLYHSPHLPQGAPTSPALANLIAYRLDARLSGLASSAGARYTRYADDLAFSGDVDFARSLRRFVIHVGAIAIEEGFDINPRKTRIMHQSLCQRLAGIVVNDRPNISRSDYDRLKAILHNCLTHGPSGQNLSAHPDFRSHLAGRVAYVCMLNPERGARLRAMLDAIVW